ncbi:hypothetical protein ACWCOP_12220 [Maricaulaceae bacterium MS644]
MSPAELAVLDRLNQRRRTFRAGRDMVLQKQRSKAACIVASRWACSYKILPNGLLQIANIQLSGDFIGLRSVLL